MQFMFKIKNIFVFIANLQYIQSGEYPSDTALLGKIITDISCENAKSFLRLQLKQAPDFSVTVKNFLSIRILSKRVG